jgi:mannitol/fructose-specific phosphotransferase system IIA component (Ntr-type)
MRLQELIPKEHILMGLTASDKWEAIASMLAHLAAAGSVPPELTAQLQAAVAQRERSMSTGMERGIAIPHAAVDCLPRVVACLAIADGEHAIPFDSIDSSPAWLVVLLLIPKPQKLLHIRTLADLARVLGNQRVRLALREARTSAEAWEALGVS